MNFSTAMDNKYGVVRLIKQLHFTLSCVWDDEYLAAHKKLYEDAARATSFSEYGKESILDKDRFEFDVALHIHAEQIKLMARNNLLPQKDMETTIDGPPIVEEVLPDYLTRTQPVPVPIVEIPERKNERDV